MGGDVPVPGAVCFVPAAHTPCGRHVLWLFTFEYVPFGHDVQAWSLDVVPARLTYSPATQVVHAVQDAWFALDVYVPLAQEVHVRSVVEDPFDTTCSPAGHVVFEAHAVAEVVSSSHVSPVQSTFAAVPPAQYVPDAHAVH